jgi:3-oxoacyl-[acyl-carrier-protein] synthase II
MGHLLGASGAVELIAMAKTLQTGVIPPTINLDNIDPQCDPRMDFVPKTARNARVDFAISNSLGFGGHNSCLVCGKI